MMKKFNQSPNMLNNAFIGPTKQIIQEVNDDMYDAEEALKTNAAILKKSVKQARLNQFAELKNEAISELKEIPHEMLDVKKWNGFKEDTSNTIESLGSKTINEFKDVNKNLSKVGKSALTESNKAVSQSRKFLSQNTPKVTKTMTQSLKSIFKRRQSFNQKDLALLEKLSQLKVSGVLTQKEFDIKKKKILARI